jgi:hypothetical protein
MGPRLREDDGLFDKKLAVILRCSPFFTASLEA